METMKNSAFKTELTSAYIDLYIVKESSRYVLSHSRSNFLTLSWLLDLDARLQGIKSISPIILEISGQITIENDKTGEERFEEFFYKKGVTKGWNIEIDGEMKFSHGIYPKSIEIFYNIKEITVTF